MDLPCVQVLVSGGVFRAEGAAPCPWSIYAEAERPLSARTRITVDGADVADITIHAKSREALPTEVQEISAALIWSALRARSPRIGAEV